MRRHVPWLAATALLLVALVAASAGSPPAGFWAPEGFVARADTLIQQGALELHCGERDSIAVRIAPDSPEETFFHASYLRSDVRRFNEAPAAARSPFLVEGCRLVGVDPFFHRVDLPYNRLPRWRGDVLFTFDTRTATLEGGANQELEIRQPTDPGDASRAAERVSPDRAGARTLSPLLRLVDPLGTEVVADAFFIGDAPVLADRRDVGSADALRVNGFRTPPGRVVRLSSGDWLQLDLGAGQAGRRWTYVVETGERARTASFVRVRNDRVDRLFPARRLEPVLRPFSQAMDLALQSIPGAGSGAVTDLDVRLTLHRELSQRLDEHVAAWCRENAHPTRPRGVSMLIMDAFSGAVRAMPSCPGADELAPWEPLPTRTRERFLANQNLAAHPVGSAAKPFWTAAVATTHPNLLDLRIAAHPAGPADRVLGCTLRAPYQDGHGSEDWTGLEAFLARSCNRYQVELATAALALGSETARPECRGVLDPAAFARCFPDAGSATGAAGGAGAMPQGGAQEGAEVAAGGGGAEVAAGSGGASGDLRICDTVIRTVLEPGLEVVGGGCEDLQLVDAAFRPGPALSRIANISVYRDPSPGGLEVGGAPELGDRYRLGRYRVDVWRTVLGELEAAGDTAHLDRTALRFASVSPHAANLALNTVEELRTDWVNLLLGGENSRWSNFELAEAQARLMTGRAVRGSFADRMGAGPGAADMTGPGAADAGGPTGATGSTGAGAGEGSPGAATAPLLPGDVLDSGVRRRVLHAMELVVGPEGTAAGLAPAAARLRERLRSAAPDTPYDVWVFGKTGTPSVEVFGSGGSEARQGGVLVLGVLAAPADQGRSRSAGMEDWISACSMEPGLRRAILEVPPADLLDPDRAVAFSVAVYLDDLDPGQGSGRAVQLTGRVLDDLGDYLEDEVRRKALP